ncbi:MAG: hypothetical protein IPG22_22680 [Acidobacteria bacterium]|nr:hypothetical protein [Acidobacteriota bacterium]
MNKNKYLLMVSSIGVFVLLAAAAVSENFMKDWHGIQGVVPRLPKARSICGFGRS